MKATKVIGLLVAVFMATVLFGGMAYATRLSRRRTPWMW